MNILGTSESIKETDFGFEVTYTHYKNYKAA